MLKDWMDKTIVSALVTLVIGFSTLAYTGIKGELQQIRENLQEFTKVYMVRSEDIEKRLSRLEFMICLPEAERIRFLKQYKGALNEAKP